MSGRKYIEKVIKERVKERQGNSVICTEYEIPADTEAQVEKRKKDGENIYKTLVGGNEG